MGVAGTRDGLRHVDVVSASDIGIPLTTDAQPALLPRNIDAFSEGLGIDVDDVRLYLALRELHRVLVPGGRHLFTVPLMPGIPETFARTVVLPDNRRGEIVGYCAGNDVSSRDIEGENPLYLPQAKVYASACSIGPAILIATGGAPVFEITLRILAEDGQELFSETTSTARMRRSFDELVSWLETQSAGIEAIKWLRRCELGGQLGELFGRITLPLLAASPREQV